MKLQIVLLVFAVLLVIAIGERSAQGAQPDTLSVLLSDKVLVTEAACQNEQNEVVHCFVLAKPGDSTRGWLLLEDTDHQPDSLIEFDLKTNKDKTIWNKAWFSM